MLKHLILLQTNQIQVQKSNRLQKLNHRGCTVASQVKSLPAAPAPVVTGSSSSSSTSDPALV